PEPETPVTTTSSPVGIARLRFLRLFWRAPRMTIASPGICSCFTAANFSGLLRWFLRLAAADEQISHQRAAVRAVDDAGGVELELVAVAAQAVVLRAPVLGHRHALGAPAPLAAVLGKPDDVLLCVVLRVFHSRSFKWSRSPAFHQGV